MRQFLQTLWWWLRVAVLVIVATYALASLWNNSRQPDVTLWYWPGRPAAETSVVALAIVSFLLGGVICTTGWALFSATVKYRRTRAHRRQRMVVEQRATLARKAAMLRVKPAPAPIVREPKRPVPVFAPAAPATQPPEPIVVEMSPPPVATKSPFSAGSIPVVVDQVVVMTPSGSSSSTTEEVIDVVASPVREDDDAGERPDEAKPST